MGEAPAARTETMPSRARQRAFVPVGAHDDQGLHGATGSVPGARDQASLSGAFTLPDIADWLSYALHDLLVPQTQPLLPRAQRLADAQMALAVYGDWKTRTGDGAGF